MKYGILGDIHANISALEAVLKCLEHEGVDAFLSVGDVVGYGAAPKECIEKLRQIDATVVLGNHDAACCGRLDVTRFNRFARAAVHWTIEELDREELRWLDELPLVAVTETCCVAHSTLEDPEHYSYIQTTRDADPSLEMLRTLERGICFVGHSHVPITLVRLEHEPNCTGYTRSNQIPLDGIERAICNVGSVGQPRDGDPRAAYGILDSDQDLLRIERVEYDIEREARRIRDAGLPEMLAERLFAGN